MKIARCLIALFALSLITGIASAQTCRPEPQTPPVPTCDPDDSKCVNPWMCQNAGVCFVGGR